MLLFVPHRFNSADVECLDLIPEKDFPPIGTSCVKNQQKVILCVYEVEDPAPAFSILSLELVTRVVFPVVNDERSDLRVPNVEIKDFIFVAGGRKRLFYFFSC